MLAEPKPAEPAGRGTVVHELLKALGYELGFPGETCYTPSPSPLPHPLSLGASRGLVILAFGGFEARWSLFFFVFLRLLKFFLFCSVFCLLLGGFEDWLFLSVFRFGGVQGILRVILTVHIIDFQIPGILTSHLDSPYFVYLIAAYRAFVNIFGN